MQWSGDQFSTKRLVKKAVTSTSFWRDQEQKLQKAFLSLASLGPGVQQVRTGLQAEQPDEEALVA
eukprot:245749-Amphidinium_carterae.1